MFLKIKICGVKYNVQEICNIFPDFIGFIFYNKSPRFVGKNFFLPKKFNHNVLKVGVFVNENIKNIINIVIKNNLDFIQLHGEEDYSYCKDLYKKGIKIIKSFKITSSFSMQKIYFYQPFCSYFLFDNNGGSGKKFCWNYLKNYNFDLPFFLSGGIGIEDIDKIKKFNHPKMFGVDINSRFEIYPGKKNKETLKKFIKNIKK